MVTEMLDEEDKGFSNWGIEFLDKMNDCVTFSLNERAKIGEIYERKM